MRCHYSSEGGGKPGSQW